MRNNCIKIESEQCPSIDEQIIPAKTKRSGGAKQCNPQKIHKWGFRSMVRVGQSGFIYDLCVWREIQRGYRKVRCRRVIYAVSKENSKELKSPSIFRELVFDLTTTHQIEQNGHFGNSSLHRKSNWRVPKDLKANGRGSFDFRIDLNSSLRLIKWYDNKAVILGSTFSSVQSTSDEQRWDAKKKEHCKIKYPYMVKD